jgi:hypothetical protein
MAEGSKELEKQAKRRVEEINKCIRNKLWYLLRYSHRSPYKKWNFPISIID